MKPMNERNSSAARYVLGLTSSMRISWLRRVKKCFMGRAARTTDYRTTDYGRLILAEGIA